KPLTLFHGRSSSADLETLVFPKPFLSSSLDSMRRSWFAFVLLPGFPISSGAPLVSNRATVSPLPCL
ncbi:hypothetical protein KI387_003460, partial [Taxus chinensis]